MTEDGSTEIAAAAATGAAAAVDAVTDQQAEAERVDALAGATIAAEGAAQDAAVSAEVAAETTEIAAEVATEAIAAAGDASAEATTAVAEATEARSEVAELRDGMNARFDALISVLDKRLPPPTESGTEPEEVTVGETKQPDSTAASGTDSGSAGSAESGTGDTERRPRHRFGSRRS